MSGWLFAIVGISIMTYVIKILLPKGKTSNLLSFIFSAVFALSAIMPISKIINDDNATFAFEEFNYDEEYIDFVADCHQDYYLTLSKYELDNLGIKLNYADFIFYENAGIYTLKKIYIKKSDLVIIENNEHINISYQISSALASLFSIRSEDVIIYE